MRILSLTAGAATMYCGSCLRDNALATEVLARGHEVTLVPLYTPTLTDEPNVSRKRVFFGGVSVYLQQHLSLFRRTPRWFDRLWDSPSSSWTAMAGENEPGLRAVLWRVTDRRFKQAAERLTKVKTNVAAKV